MQSNRTIPDGAGPSGDVGASSSSSVLPAASTSAATRPPTSTTAAARRPPMSTTAAARRPPTSSFIPPRTTYDEQCPSGSAPTASDTTTPRAPRGVMSYFTAGRNASAGRDKNVGPLDR